MAQIPHAEMEREDTAMKQERWEGQKNPQPDSSNEDTIETKFLSGLLN